MAGGLHVNKPALAMAGAKQARRSSCQINRPPARVEHESPGHLQSSPLTARREASPHLAALWIALTPTPSDSGATCPPPAECQGDHPGGRTRPRKALEPLPRDSSHEPPTGSVLTDSPRVPPICHRPLPTPSTDPPLQIQLSVLERLADAAVTLGAMSTGKLTW